MSALVNDCKDCQQIKSMRDLMEIQNKNINNLVRTAEESAKDRQQINLNQTKVDCKIEHLTTVVDDIAVSVKEFHITTTQRFDSLTQSNNDQFRAMKESTDEKFKEIRDEKIDNIKRWKWAIIIAGLGIMGQIALQVITYLKEIALH